MCRPGTPPHQRLHRENEEQAAAALTSPHPQLMHVPARIGLRPPRARTFLLGLSLAPRLRPAPAPAPTPRASTKSDAERTSLRGGTWFEGGDGEGDTRDGVAAGVLGMVG
jgi:hypothetical protein